jgi:hypothetical protein
MNSKRKEVGDMPHEFKEEQGAKGGYEVSELRRMVGWTKMVGVEIIGSI